MQRGVDSYDEAPAVPLAPLHLRKGNPIRVQDPDPFLGRSAQLTIDVRLVPTMHAAGKEQGASADDASVRAAPFDELGIPGGELLDLGSGQDLLRSESRTRFTSRS